MKTFVLLQPLMIAKLLKHNKWMLAYLMWVCGLIIVYSTFVSDPDDRKDLIVYNCLFSVLLPLLFIFITGWVRKVGLILFSLLALAPSLVETGWFIIDQSVLIRNQLWAIFATNPAETSGFLSMVQWWQWLLLGCYLCITITLLVLALRESNTPTNYVPSVIAGVLVISLLLIPGIRYNVPCVNLYNSYRGYVAEVQLAKTFMQNRQNLDGVVSNELADSSATVVVIIGESLNRKHSSLYGYCRQTNPKLEKRNDIVAYRNVQSADFMTQTVLQQVLSFATDEDPKARWNKPTLPELLNAAGWHTYWYDPYEGRMNTSNTTPTSFQAIAKLCNTFYLSGEDEQYDETHLSHLDDVLRDSAAIRKAVFLHLIGNHFPYERRYPQSFSYFSDEDICSPYLDKLSAKQKKVINAYDDAVRYNDWLIDSVLNRLSQQSGSCALLYFPDHGEEVFDDDFYAGRSYNHITHSLYEIPCIFWQNEEYATKHPLYIDEEKAYCTNGMIHTLLDLFALSYVEKDTCRSLFRHDCQVNNE